MKMKRTNELSNIKCNLASHINKILDSAIELGLRNSFQDLEFHLKQQWKYYHIVQPANSYHLQNASEWFLKLQKI